MKATIPTMSRSHFEFLASTLGRALAEKGFARTDVEALVSAMLPRLSLTNERFDKQKFLTVVNGFYDFSNNIHDKE